MIKKFSLILFVLSLVVAPILLAGNGASKSTYGELMAYSQNTTSGDVMNVLVWEDPY